MSAERFTWTELWPEGARSDGWSHSGIAVDAEGRVVFAAPEGGALIRLGGAVAAERIALGLTEVHGISRDPVEPGLLWLADPGGKPRPEDGYRSRSTPGRAVAWRDQEEFDLDEPRIAAYEAACWRPTSVVGDAGGVWVADGYGASLVHRFDRAGRHLFTLDGAGSGAPFACPHGVVVSPIDEEPVLTIADRGNRRLLRYLMDGTLLAVIEDDLLTSPSGLAERGEELVVTELHGGLLAVDARGRVRSLLPATAPAERFAPWPNAVRDGRLVRPPLTDGVLHSPHGVAVDADGGILLTEWLIGGRQWRLDAR